MIKIAICDDECNEREKLKEYISKFFSKKSQNIVVNEYESGSQLICRKEQYDIIFLDIEMPELNGMKVGEVKAFGKKTLEKIL